MSLKKLAFVFCVFVFGPAALAYDDGDGGNDPPTPTSPDRDRDGVPDSKDACPGQHGVARTNPARNGCPGFTEVNLKTGEIKPGDPILFKGRTTVLHPVSIVQLIAIAEVLKLTPQIRRVFVDAFTDDKGKEIDLQLLSLQRAEAVAKFLIGRGVSPERLVPRGFGPNHPHGATAQNIVEFWVVATAVVATD